MVSELHGVPSAFTVGAEHCWVTGSNVPAAISQSSVGTGHPWHVPEWQMPFVVCALPSSHLSLHPCESLCFLQMRAPAL